MRRTTSPTSLLRGLIPAVLLLAFAAAPARAQVSITSFGTALPENFNTLASSGTSSVVPAGWAFLETGTGANTLYSAGTGSSTGGDTYSFGAASNSERAFGGLQSGSVNPTVGASYANNTGGTITSLDITYTGEQWRLGAAGRSDRNDFQYSLNATALNNGTWVDVDTLDFSSPNTTTAGALDGNAAANRTTLTASITGLSIPSGAVFWIRWTDLNVSGSDDGLAVDDFSLTADGVGGGTVLTINNVTVLEGDSGTTNASFTVSLSAPAGPGGVTFDIATQDNTATTANNDYAAQSLTGQTIPEGSSSAPFTVVVNGDTTQEPDETYFVNVTNVTGATIADGQGVGTITNDDVTLTLIHDIQGSGSTSPVVGTTVTTRGIVTGLRTSGFFLQARDADADADPQTSEGIFVYTGSTPPGSAALGTDLYVTGTVAEFVPSADPVSPAFTELNGTISVILLSTGNTLPTPVTLVAADTSPTGAIDQLERFEGMRVTVPSLTVIAPTGDASINEPNATSTTNGLFYGVITGVPRPYREAGIASLDPLPAGSPCCVPRFDENPERLRIDSDGQVGASPIEVTAGATVTGITGPLDFAYRTHTIHPDAATPPGVSGNVTAAPLPAPAAGEATVASFNLERFFDTTNDPGITEPVLTPTAFANRLNKASLTIRNVMRSPDVIGVSEVENLTTLQALATKLNSDTVAGGDPDPGYTAYLEEGNDQGGIDVGLLVKASRVTVGSVTQHGLSETYIDPNTGQPDLLNDRPPLVLVGTMNPAGGPAFPLTVIANHLRSLLGIDDAADGNRIRTKRRAQAEYLANLIQGWQLADATRRIVAVGDFNAFQVNDGYVDGIGTIKGTPTLPDNVVLASSDLVNPDLTDLADGPPSQQYSFTFDGNAQQLDHIIVTGNVLPQLTAFRFGRVNADFPESYRNDPNRPERLSDHDLPMAYLRGLSADLQVGIADLPDPAYGGDPLTYTIGVANLSVDVAEGLSLSVTLPPTASFVSASGTGWACGQAAGVVTCTRANLGAGPAPDVTVTVQTPPAGGSLLCTTAIAATTADPVTGNNNASATTTVTSDILFKDGFDSGPVPPRMRAARARR